ncbi:uncharacterized protein LOC123427088 isoform X2 [Hordeum vulgare subsp. vulgare]|uniref:uncharacterized protein LOC123427088 isoform X2 n=1 Tax=Hordeum vulgare subsp. vulgare TaxID=112509 RepID=UPI000295135B|nr:uncharacterized protein LOC123427088 isoform X2 [Hordeum vulgare subsp. vulgare]
MASAVLSYIQNLWPLSALLKEDDLGASARLVRTLPVPEETKQFVFAIREPETQGLLYILAAQNLSEQSALDAGHLIRAVRPRAVITQVAHTEVEDVLIEEQCLAEGGAGGVPASPFQVIKRCITEKKSKDHYVKSAACQVLREIFGVGFYGHLLAAKRAAEETESHFLLLGSPYEKNCNAGGSSNGNSTGDNSAQQSQTSCSLPQSAMDDKSGLQLQSNCLLPKSATSAVSSHVRKTCLVDDYGGQLMKSLAPTANLLLSQAISSYAVAECGLSECKPADRYEPPLFAQTVYPLLSDLYGIFVEIPSIGKAMASAQMLLTEVHKGKPVCSEMLSDVYVFGIAIEALRICLNNAGRRRINTRDNHSLEKLDFAELPSEEKCHILLVQALRSQLREFGSVVAIVDASCLAGIRRHWNTPVPSEITQLAGSCFNHYGNKNESENESDNNEVPLDNTDKKSWIAEKPVVAVGAGGTAILGFSSLSKTIQLQRHAGIVLSKLLSHGVVSAGSKSSALQFTASAEKIRAVTHTVISSVERTSLLAMRTSFYEIMQKRQKHNRPFRTAPWATFGFSLVACAGLLKHGDGIECAAEAAPSVPMIASLGRGLESLRVTSEETRQTRSQNVKEALLTLLRSLKK